MDRGIDQYLLSLSDSDEKLLESYCTLADCLGYYLGGGYEIVVHSFGIDDDFIKKIINGHYSFRSAGQQIDEYPAGAIRHLYDKLHRNLSPVSLYFSENKNGDIFRSATIGIIGDDNKIIGMMCLNFSLNTPLSDIVNMLCPPKDVIVKKHEKSDYDDDDNGYESIIIKSVNEAKETIMADPKIPSKYKNKEIIRRLSESGIFNVKDGVEICAKLLGIGITTVYMHLRNI